MAQEIRPLRRKYYGDIGRAFGGEIEKLKHHRLAVDDNGFYNIICKGLEIQKGF